MSESLLPESLKDRVMSVSDFANITNDVLQRCGTAVVVGELTELKYYNHLYFKLSDEQSAIDCLMFKSALDKISFKLEQGQKIIVVGKSSLYAKSGHFRLIASHIYQEGLGALLARLEKLKLKLEKEGLFDPKRKRTLPFFIKKVALVTSKEGEVLHDLKRTVLRRNPLIELVLFETRVQGAEAPALIVQALKKAYLEPNLDAIILARGGGSREDLLPFWDEEVARTVALSPVPLISAIGHEPDVVLTDYVADLRAATPTAAAELISTPTLEDFILRILSLEDLMKKALENRLNNLGLALDELTLSLNRHEPKLKILNYKAKLDALEFNLKTAINASVQQKIAFFQDLQLRLNQNQVKVRLERALYLVNLDEKKATSLIKERLNTLSFNIETLDKKLKQQDPKLKALNLNAELKFATLRLQKALEAFFYSKEVSLQNLDLRLRQIPIKERLKSYNLTLDLYEKRLSEAMNQRLQESLSRNKLLEVKLERIPLKSNLKTLDLKIKALNDRLIALNPLKVLERGYSVTLKDKQSVKFESLKKDDLLETLVLGGRVYSKVVELKKDL